MAPSPSRWSMPPVLLHVLLVLLVFSSILQHAPPCSAATVNGTLTAGQALTVGDKLVSRNGKFALGFFQPTAPATLSKSPNWYLGVWFNKIPVFTAVWVANRDTPIPGRDINQTQLSLSSAGNLVVITHAGNNKYSSVVWSTSIANRTSRTGGTNTTTTTTSAVLLDTGNLAVVADNRSSAAPPLWESFDHPTDVVLPGAKFGRNKVTGLNRVGVSRKSLLDPGRGSYSVELAATGVVLKRRDPAVVYWSWLSSSSLQLIPILKSILALDPRTKGLVNPTYVDDGDEEYYMYTSLDESSSSFVSLDISGQIKLNVWSHANQTWQNIYSQPVDACTPAGTCGPFTVCDGNARPVCDCMESFSRKSPQDWELDDRTGGCRRTTQLDCRSEGNTMRSSDVFHPIARVTLPYNPHREQPAAAASDCAQICLTDCSCTAYSFNSSKCSVWRGGLLSVNRNDGIDNNSEDVLYIRLATKDLQNLRKEKRKQISVGVVTAASIICSVGLLLLVILLVIWRKKFKLCGGAPLYDSRGSGGIIAFRYTDLSHATKNFSEQLGKGGFGSVYKGVLRDSTPIAVKRLDGARQGEKQFRAEVSSIGLIQHINLVKLIGFCCEGDSRLLVYEHMSNGSLDGHLFKTTSAAVLSWNTRYQIALGVARGLSYLHQSCHERIIHCDIKPENILLDASFAPKVADFGMAAFVGREFSRILTTFRGTAGYLAPEWLSGVAITPKIDVYGFGMVLLEIVSGRRNSPEAYSSSSYHVDYFPVQAISKLREGDVPSLVDPRLHGDFSSDQVERVCRVAYWCIQDNESDRPTMAELVRVLEGLQEVGMPPMPRLLAAITEQSDGCAV